MSALLVTLPFCTNHNGFHVFGFNNCTVHYIIQPKSLFLMTYNTTQKKKINARKMRTLSVMSLLPSLDMRPCPTLIPASMSFIPECVHFMFSEDLTGEWVMTNNYKEVWFGRALITKLPQGLLALL